MDELLLITGGVFEMGEVYEEGVRLATGVQQVTRSDVCLNKYEIAVDELAALVKDTGYASSAKRGENPDPRRGKMPMPRTEVDYTARSAGGVH